MTDRPSGPIQVPTLNGIPTADPQESFWVEKPWMPQWARIDGSEAGKPKQSGIMNSWLVTPSSRRKKPLPRRIWRMMDSCDGARTSFSSIDAPDGNQRPAATYFLTRSNSSG